MGEKAMARYSYADYLALNAESEVKYEFHDGFIVAMAGGTGTHAKISANVVWSVNDALRSGNKDCSVFSSDGKIRIDSSNRDFFPDASVVCGPERYSEDDPHAIINPILLVEVLSKNTAAFDRGEKFHHYRELTSLREYLLISQDEYMVDTYFRTADGTWEINTYDSPQAEILLKSIDVTITIRDIYRRVTFEEE